MDTKNTAIMAIRDSAPAFRTPELPDSMHLIDLNSYKDTDAMSKVIVAVLKNGKHISLYPTNIQCIT